MHDQPRPSRRQRVIAALAVVLLGGSLFAGCDQTTPPTGSPGASGAAAAESLAPRDVNDPPNDSSPGEVNLDLPSPEKGDVPPAATTPVLAGHLGIGDPGPSTTTTVGAGGGTASADGIALGVPAGALGADTPISIAASPAVVLASTPSYGGAVRPVTPLFTIDDGGADLSAPVTVTLAASLPAKLPAGATVMAFYYDRDTGILSPLSPLGFEGGKLTALATHFSEILGMVVDWSKVPATVDSGFRPGVDDWEFNNYGSYVAIGGQCEGQTLSEIWYYGHQKDADAKPLFGRYDNNGGTQTPDFWADDSQGYRLVGSVHDDPTVDVAGYLQFRDPQWAAADNRQTYDAFRAAIALSGQPQMIRISTDGVDGGHTMVIYRATATRLYVADPNYVGKLRTIVYTAATGLLKPYSSGASATSIAANGDTSYTHFAYVPVLAARTNASIAARWAQLQAKQAGSTTYPTYTLRALTGKDAAGKDVWTIFDDGFSTAQADLVIQVSKLGDGHGSSMAVYQGATGKQTGDWGWKQTLHLAPGANAVGLLIYGKQGTQWGYVDFKRLTINRTDAASAAPTVSAAAGGRWVRTTSAAEAGSFSKPFTKSDESLKFTISDGAMSMAYNYAGPPHRNETASGSWGSPPGSAAPGDAWATSLSVKGACKGDIDESWAAGVSVGITYLDASSQMGSAGASATATCAQGSGSASLSFTFPPAPADGSTPVKIYVEAGDPHGQDTWDYVYTWQP
jgi:hypothetical protein